MEAELHLHHLQDILEYKTKELQKYQDEKDYPQTYPRTDNDNKLREEKDSEINQIKSRLYQLTTIIYDNQVTKSTLEQLVADKDKEIHNLKTNNNYPVITMEATTIQQWMNKLLQIKMNYKTRINNF